MHKENDGLIILALFGKRERELIKCLECLGLDLTEGDGMAWWIDGRHYATISLNLQCMSEAFPCGLETNPRKLSSREKLK